MIRKIHKRKYLPAFYIPDKTFKDLGWKQGDTLELELNGNEVLIKKTDKLFTQVQSLANKQKFMTLPISYDSLNGSNQCEIDVKDNVMIVKII